VNLGPTVNSTARDLVPTFSRDGHWMFFASERSGGFGGADIWASWRAHTHDDFGWETPINLGPGVNTAFNDNGVGYFENDDGGAPQLFFGSNRPGVSAVPTSTSASFSQTGRGVLRPGFRSSAAALTMTIGRTSAMTGWNSSSTPSAQEE
jgi:hypothetical protein